MTDFEKRQLEFGIGLTGSIACGKSTIGRLLEKEGFLVIDADQISRKAVESGSKALKKIEEHFGKDFLLEDGIRFEIISMQGPRIETVKILLPSKASTENL